MSNSDQLLNQTAEAKITDEDLDDFLAIGGEVFRGVELFPEGMPDSPWPPRASAQRSEFAKGNVLPTVYLDIPKGADKYDRLGALMAYCKRRHRS